MCCPPTPQRRSERSQVVAMRVAPDLAKRALSGCGSSAPDDLPLIGPDSMGDAHRSWEAKRLSGKPGTAPAHPPDGIVEPESRYAEAVSISCKCLERVCPFGAACHQLCSSSDTAASARLYALSAST